LLRDQIEELKRAIDRTKSETGAKPSGIANPEKCAAEFAPRFNHPYLKICPLRASYFLNHRNGSIPNSFVPRGELTVIAKAMSGMFLLSNSNQMP
jgi:hypothetical protein